MSKGKELFTCISSISDKKEFVEDMGGASGYVLLMWIAQDKALAPICNAMNKFVFDIDDRLIYKYLYKAVPKKKRFIKWTKKEGDATTKKTEPLESLMDEYGISLKEASLALKRIL